VELSVVFRHCDPSDAVRRYAERKLARLSRLLAEGAAARVVLSADRAARRAEVSLASRGVAVAAAEETDDFYAALDLVVDKLERRFRDARERRRARPAAARRRAARGGAPTA
jgi:putative sigma-54 modulation protein